MPEKSALGIAGLSCAADPWFDGPWTDGSWPERPAAAAPPAMDAHTIPTTTAAASCLMTAAGYTAASPEMTYDGLRGDVYRPPRETPRRLGT